MSGWAPDPAKLGRKPLNRLDILTRIDRARFLKGERLTIRDADRGMYGLPSPAAIRKHCGSWVQALTDAGIETDNRGARRSFNYSTEQHDHLRTGATTT